MFNVQFIHGFDPHAADLETLQFVAAEISIFRDGLGNENLIAPEWLITKQKEVRHELKLRARAAKEAELKRLELRAESLKPADVKRVETDKAIRLLRKELANE